MSEYDIRLNNTQKLWEWISQQPNLILLKPILDGGNRVYCQFNHTPQEEAAFKQEVANRISQIDIGNNTFENTLEKITAIQTDQYFYGCEFAPPGITKTNIGTTYVNIFTDLSGRPFFIDTTGFTRMAVQILWTKVGTGTQTLRIVEDLTNTQIIESPSLVTGSNDFANVNIPQGALKFKGHWRLQAKSTVAADDPIFLGFRLYLRR